MSRCLIDTLKGEDNNKLKRDMRRQLQLHSLELKVGITHVYDHVGDISN